MTGGEHHEPAGTRFSFAKGRRARFVAKCRCGWETEKMTTAGLAQAALDAHLHDQSTPGEPGQNGAAKRQP